MLSPDKVPAEIEQIGNCSMRRHESPRLHYRLEPPHPTLPHSGSLMRLLCSIIFILFSAMNYFRHQFSMSDWITAEFISHNLPRLSAIGSQ